MTRDVPWGWGTRLSALFLGLFAVFVNGAAVRGEPQPTPAEGVTAFSAEDSETLSDWETAPYYRDPQLIVNAEGFTGVPITKLAISNDGRWLAAAGDKVVRVWNLNTQLLHATLRGYQEPYGYAVGTINTLAFSPDSQFLAVGVTDNTEFGSTRIYDLNRPSQLHALVKGHLGCTKGIAFSPDGRFLATWGCDGNTILMRWDGQRGTATELFRVRYYDDSINWPEVPEETFQFTSDSRWLVFSKGYRGRYLLVSMVKQQAVTDIDDWPRELLSLATRIDARQFPGGKESESTTTAAFQIDMTGRALGTWCLQGGRTITNSSQSYWVGGWNYGIQPNVVHSHAFNPTAVAWNPQAGLAASADQLGEVHVWDPETGDHVIPPLKPVNRRLWDVAWSQDGGRLYFADTHYDSRQYHYNRFGSSSSQFDLTRGRIEPAGRAIPDDDVFPEMKTARQTWQIRPVKTTIDARELPKPMDSHGSYQGTVYDLHLVDPATSQSINLVPWRDTKRLASFDNPNILIPPFRYIGRPMCFRFIQYPGSDARTLVLGTDDGYLVEGTIEIAADGAPYFRVRRWFLGHSARVTSLSVSPDQRFLASSSLDGTIRIWSLRKPRILGDVDFLSTGTSIRALGPEAKRCGLRENDVVQTFGGTTFFERVRDIQAGHYTPGMVVDLGITRWNNGASEKLTKQIRLVSAPDLAEPELSLFLARDGQWIAWTQDGMYSASSQGARFVGWHVNQQRHRPADYYRFDQYQEHLYQPKIVRYVLETGDAKLAAARLRAELDSLPSPPLAINASEYASFEQALPPQAQLLSPTTGSLKSGPILLRAEVQPQSGSATQDVHFTVNSRPVGEQAQRVSVNADNGTEIYEQTVKLEPGDYEVAVVAKDSRDLSDRQAVQVSVTPPPGQQVAAKFPLPEDRPNLYVLAIGISRYRDEAFRLHFAHRDAEEFASAWQVQEGRLFGRVVTKTLTNEDATVAEMKQALHWLTTQAVRRSDVAIVMISGHGVFDTDDTWYFGAHELDPNRLFQSAISFDELNLFLRKIRSNLIVFADTCHAGQFVAGVGVKSVGTRGIQIWHGSGTLSYASCLPDQQSFENEAWGHGAFTKAILEFLGDTNSTRALGDYDRDGLLSFSELQVYVNARVKQLTDGRQNPDAHIPAGISEVYLAGVSQD